MTISKAMDLRPLVTHEDEGTLTILFGTWEISSGWSFYGSMVSQNISYIANSKVFFPICKTVIYTNYQF